MVVKHAETVLYCFSMQYNRINDIFTSEELYTECPKKHGNLVTNWISSFLRISIVIPNFKSLNIIMSARVYFMKRVKDCKDVF